MHCGDLVTHDVAQAACAAWGGSLAALDSATAQGCPTAADDSWIGLQQSSTAITVGGGWTWNGAPAISYTNWDVGEPDDVDGVENGEEQCGYRVGADGTWHDDVCAESHAFLCRR